MFTIVHQQLQNAILESYVLQKILTPTQQKKFLEESLHLPPTAQEKLLLVLQEEQQELENKNKKTRLAIRLYQQTVEEKTKTFVHTIFKNAQQNE